MWRKCGEMWCFATNLPAPSQNHKNGAPRRGCFFCSLLNTRINFCPGARLAFHGGQLMRLRKKSQADKEWDEINEYERKSQLRWIRKYGKK